MDSDEVRVESLSFTRYVMKGRAPISALFPSGSLSATCGIYILEFATGERYVGQTTNLVSRYVDHARHHRDIVAFQFAVCPQALLDQYERAIVQREQITHSLRNLMLTNRPGGNEDLEVTVAEALSVTLPWLRSDRVTTRSEPETSKNGRFWSLSRHPHYPQIREHLARYVHETIPDPLNTAGLLWSLTALPSTSRAAGRRRLLTVNCGSVETLFLTEYTDTQGDQEMVWSINLWPDVPDKTLRTLHQQWPGDLTYESSQHYKSVGPLTSVDCRGQSAVGEVLTQAAVLDAAYRLNVMLMRRAKTIYTKHHNEAFCADVLREAAGLARNE